MNFSISELKNKAEKAPKFILCAFNQSTGGFVYVSNRLKVTEDVKEAMKYSFGFDDENIKAKAHSISTGYEFLAIPA